uniref:Putative secreted peptide n=1 Tax=Anopheles braziliensis TaxID=58242 RepID=A0A2M3ZNA5_9DIPT
MPPSIVVPLLLLWALLLMLLLAMLLSFSFPVLGAPLRTRSSSSENCSNVSKHVLANSSRSFSSVSQPANGVLPVVAEWIDPLFRITTASKMNCCGISWLCGRISSRISSITWQSIVSSKMSSSSPRSSTMQTLFVNRN